MRGVKLRILTGLAFLFASGLPCIAQVKSFGLNTDVKVDSFNARGFQLVEYTAALKPAGAYNVIDCTHFVATGCTWSLRCPATNYLYGVFNTAATTSIQPYYLSCYNKTHKAPRWTFHELGSNAHSNIKTSFTWHTPRSVGTRHESGSFPDSPDVGTQRGHLTPRSDRAGDEIAEASTHLVINRVPQDRDLNQTQWFGIEGMIREFSEYDTSHRHFVLTEAIYPDRPGTETATLNNKTEEISRPTILRKYIGDAFSWAYFEALNEKPAQDGYLEDGRPRQALAVSYVEELHVTPDAHFLLLLRANRSGEATIAARFQNWKTAVKFSKDIRNYYSADRAQCDEVRFRVTRTGFDTAPPKSKFFITEYSNTCHPQFCSISSKPKGYTRPYRPLSKSHELAYIELISPLNAAAEDCAFLYRTFKPRRTRNPNPNRIHQSCSKKIETFLKKQTWAPLTSTDRITHQVSKDIGFSCQARLD